MRPGAARLGTRCACSMSLSFHLTERFFAAITRKRLRRATFRGASPLSERPRPPPSCLPAPPPPAKHPPLEPHHCEAGAGQRRGGWLRDGAPHAVGHEEQRRAPLADQIRRSRGRLRTRASRAARSVSSFPPW